MSLRTKWRPTDLFLVCYRDRDILVVEKKAGVLTVGRPSGRGVDLMTALEHHNGGRAPIAVHRLDRPVSGLLVVARHPRAERALIEQFKEHAVERRYLAAVSGLMKDDEGTFESRLESKDASLRMRSSERGKRAITHYKVVDRAEAAEVSFVEIELETGVRNQIRVHFAEAGHPLLGEKKYLDPDDPESSAAQGTERIFLHADVLGFQHPMTGRPLRFEAPLPAELMGWRKRLLRATRP